MWALSLGRGAALFVHTFIAFVLAVASFLGPVLLNVFQTDK
ncbi:hypothetical protein [Leifsonia poae]|nr:hypothetical protein [Leifsonia poae]